FVLISRIDLERRRLQVPSKWLKLRDVYLSQRTVELLRRYLERRREFLRDKADRLRQAGKHSDADALLRSDFLFVSERTGKPLTASGARQTLKEAAQRAGLDASMFTPRNLRLAAVHLFIERGGSIIELQDRMAHEDYMTT